MRDADPPRHLSHGSLHRILQLWDDNVHVIWYGFEGSKVPAKDLPACKRIRSGLQFYRAAEGGSSGNIDANPSWQPGLQKGKCQVIIDTAFFTIGFPCST